MATSNADLARRSVQHRARRCLVTGGAGFIGCNLTDALVRSGSDVTILDNLQRPGAEHNLEWLRRRLNEQLRVVQADVRAGDQVAREMRDVDVVYHLAGQTAVTTSVVDPRGDFDANALGTLNVLEAARSRTPAPIVVYASTNKVYGGLERLAVVEEATRYRLRDHPDGVDESQPLEFRSPYGCSKGVADQYVLAYARIYDLPAIVFRQSCVYGPRQLGSEEQGWVAWLIAAAAFGMPITIYGDGKQVRDLLYIDDLIEAYLLAVDAIERTAGNAYNIGGGRDRTISVWQEFEPLLSSLLDRPVDSPAFDVARADDQRVFFCDTRKAEADFGWRPRVTIDEGVSRLAAWVLENEAVFALPEAMR